MKDLCLLLRNEPGEQGVHGGQAALHPLRVVSREPQGPQLLPQAEQLVGEVGPEGRREVLEGAEGRLILLSLRIRINVPV